MLKKLVCIESDFEDLCLECDVPHNKAEEETYLLW